MSHINNFVMRQVCCLRLLQGAALATLRDQHVVLASCTWMLLFCYICCCEALLCRRGFRHLVSVSYRQGLVLVSNLQATPRAFSELLPEIVPLGVKQRRNRLDI